MIVAPAQRAAARVAAVAAALACCLGLCGLHGGCAGEVRPDPAQAAWAADLEAARAAAVAADTPASSAAARRALEAALEALPAAVAGVEHRAAAALVDDARFTLGRLAFEAGEPERALAEAERALAARAPDAPETVFVANLHALRALALEALDRPSAAIAAWEAAQLVHQRLFERALAAPEEGRP